jgi:hypothetical protein
VAAYGGMSYECRVFDFWAGDAHLKTSLPLCLYVHEIYNLMTIVLPERSCFVFHRQAHN